MKFPGTTVDRCQRLSLKDKREQSMTDAWKSDGDRRGNGKRNEANDDHKRPKDAHNALLSLRSQTTEGSRARSR